MSARLLSELYLLQDVEKYFVQNSHRGVERILIEHLIKKQYICEPSMPKQDTEYWSYSILNAKFQTNLKLSSLKLHRKSKKPLTEKID